MSALPLKLYDPMEYWDFEEDYLEDKILVEWEKEDWEYSLEDYVDSEES